MDSPFFASQATTILLSSCEWSVCEDIHRHNSVIRDSWCHGVTLHSQAARVGWVRTPLGGSRNHLFRRGFVKIQQLVPFFPVRARASFQEWNRYQSRLLPSLPFAPTPCDG